MCVCKVNEKSEYYNIESDYLSVNHTSLKFMGLLNPVFATIKIAEDYLKRIKSLENTRRLDEYDDIDIDLDSIKIFKYSSSYDEVK